MVKIKLMFETYAPYLYGTAERERERELLLVLKSTIL